MVVLLALTSALAYGLSDFVGGLLSRRTSAWAVAVAAQAAAAAIIAAVALVAGGQPTTSDWLWGALSGVGGGTGAAFLYRGLGAASMSVVAPISAVGAALVPVAVGVTTGERPSMLTWAGVACALPAIWLVSQAEPDHDPVDALEHAVHPQHGDRPVSRTAVVDALLAGLGFGLLFSALGQIPDAAGVGPLSMSYAVSVLATALLAVALRARWLPRDRASATAVVAGALGSAATISFLLATQTGLLTIAAVLSSLYPATTVLLAALVLHERIGRGQGLGLALAALAVGLVAAG